VKLTNNLHVVPSYTSTICHVFMASFLTLSVCVCGAHACVGVGVHRRGRVVVRV
jgi:hypothetical protein